MSRETLLAELRKADLGYWYLATPYSQYHMGTEVAFREAAKAAAWFVRHKIGVFSPIAHMHPVAIHGGIDPLDHDIWLPSDAPMMHGAYGIAVVQMRGWHESRGIRHEVEVFNKANKPVVFIHESRIY